MAGGNAALILRPILDTAPPMRSKLFVPGVRPELFGKALAGAADAISIDLEDAVPESRKDEARETVRAFLASDAARRTDKLLIVRVNPLGSPHFEADLRAVLQPGVAMVNLPKAESAADVLAAVAAMERVERMETRQDLTPPAPPSSARLLINIETPQALRRAAEIGAVHPRVAGLQLGLGDLFEPYGIARGEPANVHAVLFALGLAAAEAGVFACDGAFADIRDAEGFSAEARMARGLGFIGKSCIHPSQVALANAVFQPDDEEVARARRVLDGARDAAERGLGAFVLDGRMVDAPFLRRAEAVLAAARLARGEGAGA